MTQELVFSTIRSSSPIVQVKPKIYLFSQNHHLGSSKTTRNPELSKRKSKIDLGPNNNTISHNLWTSHLPVKRLFDDPKFFLSLQRKKFRIINGINNMSILSQRRPGVSTLRGKKLREGSMSMRRMDSNNLASQLFSETSRRGWEPSNKTPYLNFNMQYLIKKRKSMTPSSQLYHNDKDKLRKATSSQFY